jgi:hypothetical protein
VERLFKKTRLAETPGLKTLVLVPYKIFLNLVKVDPPVGARKWPFLDQVAFLFYRTPENCWIFGFSP